MNGAFGTQGPVGARRIYKWTGGKLVRTRQLDRNGGGGPHKRFYEKVIKVKADVAALRWASFFSSWSSVGGIQQRPSKIIFPISNPLYSICVFPDCGPQNID
jgi:hypothetical protein